MKQPTSHLIPGVKVVASIFHGKQILFLLKRGHVWNQCWDKFCVLIASLLMNSKKLSVFRPVLFLYVYIYIYIYISFIVLFVHVLYIYIYIYIYIYSLHIYSLHIYSLHVLVYMIYWVESILVTFSNIKRYCIVYNRKIFSPFELIVYFAKVDLSGKYSSSFSCEFYTKSVTSDRILTKFSNIL